MFASFRFKLKEDFSIASILCCFRKVFVFALPISTHQNEKDFSAAVLYYIRKVFRILVYYKLTVASPILEDADAFPVVIDKFAILSIFVKATIIGVSLPAAFTASKSTVEITVF